MTLNKIVSWDDIKIALDDIVNKIDGTFSGVYGVPKGGLVPAVILSNRLKIPLLCAPSKDCIVIDDICDSGKTMQSFGNYENNNIFKVTLFVRSSYIISHHNKPKDINLYHSIINNDVWLVFPWE